MRALYAFTAGIVVNCVYGIIQLGLAIAAGINLDRLVVGPLTAGQGGIGGINVFGTVSGSQNVYRINALTGDPNHLGVMLCVPLMVLLPYYLGDRRGRRRIGLLLLFMLVVQVLTLSRSAALGDAGRPARCSRRRCADTCRGRARSASPRRRWWRRSRPCTRRRTSCGRSSPPAPSCTAGSTQTHLQFYQLVPPALDPHPLFGMGFNTFAVFYQFVTGRTDFGPHSAWIAILVETGLVGMALYLVYFAYLLASAAAIRHSPDPDISRLGQGLLAALVATGAGQPVLPDHDVRLLLRACAPGGRGGGDVRAREIARRRPGGPGGRIRPVIVALEIAFWVSLLALVWTHLLYPLAIALVARVRPRPVAAADILPTVEPDHPRLQRGGRDRGEARERARARLPRRPARDRGHLGRLHRRHPRRSWRASPTAACA